jgi:hypothetical protein
MVGTSNGETGMQIQIEIRSVYGNETIYPACDKARAFASIAGTKTLTRRALQDIQALGFEIVVEQAAFAL